LNQKPALLVVTESAKVVVDAINKFRKMIKAPPSRDAVTIKDLKGPLAPGALTLMATPPSNYYMPGDGKWEFAPCQPAGSGGNFD